MDRLEVSLLEPLRVDKFLALHYAPHFSRSYFAYLLDQGLVLLNKKPVKKRVKVQEGDLLEIAFADTPESELIPEPIPLAVVYEDDDIIVINKPSGLVVHPAPGNWTGTLVNGLLYHVKKLQELDGGARPGIVHRLDKDTTGLLVAAKHIGAQRKLIEAFSNREVKKEYLAITVSKPKEGKIETLIGRDPKHRQKMAVVEEKGKLAVTYVKVLDQKDPFYLVHLILETGRTHQIRVHLKHLKAPVLGDPVYGTPSFNQKHQVKRPYLHAWRLEFKHPLTGALMKFEAPLPQDMACEFSFKE